MVALSCLSVKRLCVQRVFVLFLFCLQMIICCVAVFFLSLFNANTYFYVSIVFDVDFVFPKYFLIHFPGKPFSGHCPGLAGIGNLSAT